jgi:hypothetical protein
MSPESAENIVGVHVGDATRLVLPEFLLPGNRLAALLLWRVLALALIKEGLTRQDSYGGAGPELGDCVFMAAVSDPAQAVDIIKAELAAHCLLAYSQIGVVEDGRWQCVHPSPEVRMAWLMDTERLEYATNQFCQAVSNWSDTVLELLRPFLPKQRQEGDKG